MAAEERSAMARLVAEYKSKPCTDCEGKFPPKVMEFDHLPGEEKYFNIGRWKQNANGYADLKAEIAKTEIVCANCHRIREAVRAEERTSSEEEE